MSMDTLPILVIGENPAVLRSISHLIRTYGSSNMAIVGVSSGGDDAFEQAQLHRPRIVLYGFDHHSLQSLRFITQLRTLLPRAGIIALGELDLCAHQRMAWHAGADAFVARSALEISLLPTILSVGGYTSSTPRGARLGGMLHSERWSLRKELCRSPLTSGRDQLLALYSTRSQ
jgi:DNA-binding NarL/FixJ family response regulator